MRSPKQIHIHNNSIMMNHKIIGLLCLFLVSGLFSFGQNPEQNDNLKFDAKDWGVGFNVTGLIENINLSPVNSDAVPALQLRKFVDDRWAVRLELGIRTRSFDRTQVDSVDSFMRTYDSTFSQNSFYFAPSVEYHFEGTHRLDPYIGAGMALTFTTRDSRNASTDLQDTIGTANVTRNYDLPGSFTFGANVMLGFNYFIAPKLALGAEYRLGFMRQRSGGDFNIVTINSPVTGASSTSRRTGSERTVNNDFLTHQSINISLSYFFNKNRSGS